MDLRADWMRRRGLVDPTSGPLTSVSPVAIKFMVTRIRTVARPLRTFRFSPLKRIIQTGGNCY